MKNFHSALFIAALLLFVILGCQTPKTENSSNIQTSPALTPAQTVESGPVVDIPKLIGQSPEAFDKKFDKAVEINKTNDPGTVPGEIRDYNLAALAKPISTSQGIMVRFFKGKAGMIMVDLLIPTETAEEALLQAGLDVSGKTPDVKTQYAVQWMGQTFGSIKFKNVIAHRLDQESSQFTTVKAEIE